ncbi:MAG: D-glycero-beta-D-manno-heptose 1-phosphate adenylyltransferase [Sedimentisphaerales bacterium]|nr:D-glycero-beta-D-manno-heptose 1-phosphate adenylyltransferase [Sedimentisphaerales bacterium]
MAIELLQAVTSLGSPRVLVVGDFLLDSYVYGDALRISPEAPVQVLKVIGRESRPGGAASVAADVTALGGKAVCIGVVGQDDTGRQLKKILQEAGVDVSGLIPVTDRPTISKQRMIGLAQHRHRQQLLRIDEECDKPFEPSVYRQLLDACRKRIKECDAVCLQDYNKGVLTEDLSREMIALARKAGKRVLVDPPMTGDFARYKGASVITPNRREASAAIGFAIDEIQDAQKAAGILLEKLDLEAVVITLDKQGAFLQTARISEHITTIPRSVYDVTGAGDMVLATLAVALSGGCDFRIAVQLANIAGGIEVEKFGTATVSIEEIINEILLENRGKMGKIRDIAELGNELAYHRQQHRKIVFTNGCFDVLHRGHIEYLSFCKQQGDIVVLGLNSDRSVREIKGPSRPINNQHDRAAVLAALEPVDYIVIFDEADPLRLIEQVQPDVLIKGADWANKGVIGREFVESYGGRVVLAPLVDGKSSTATIQKIQSLHDRDAEEVTGQDNRMEPRTRP